MANAVREGVFPGGVLLASSGSEIQFFKAYGWRDLTSRAPVALDTVFDLASLTKPLATTLAILLLVQRKELELDQSLGDILSPFREGVHSHVTIRQLLAHSSGLPDYQPYYRSLISLPRTDRKVSLRAALAEESPLHRSGSQTVYSDLGFMILEWVAETVDGRRLDRMVYDEIYHPLGLDNLFFVDMDNPSGKSVNFAATERCPWRGETVCGAVHDDNAYAVGGIAGHAGLFGPAAEVHELLVDLLLSYLGLASAGLFDPETVRKFFTRSQPGDRALGFDMPAFEGSSAGRLFSRNTVGHLGFTGTSFWMDLDQRIIIILLTNRVHPTRSNLGIKTFRPLLHDTVMETLLG